MADRCAILRAVTHNNGNHPAAAYWMMVGSPMTRPAPQIVTMSREDRPHPGAVAARLLPGQAPYPALHLFAWRSLTLMMLGRWDEAVPVFYRALEAWNDAGRHAAGYGFRGFMAGLDIGRARGDARLVGAAVEAIESILARFPASHSNQLLHAYIRGESGLTANDPIMQGRYWFEAAERRVSLACDHREQIPREVLEAARTDGGSEWQVFRRVTVPLLAPVLSVVFITMLINVLKVFDIVISVAPGSSQDDANVIALAMWRTSFGGVNDYGLGAAIAVFLFLLVIPVLALNVRRFRREA